MVDLKVLVFAILGALVLGSSTTGYIVHRYLYAKFEAETTHQKMVANEELSKAIMETMDAERKYGQLADKMGLKYAKAKSDLELASKENRRLVRRIGGLYDPGRRARCPDTVPETAEPASGTTNQTAGARLSAEASEFLLALTKEADEAALYAKTCHEWIKTVDNAALTVAVVPIPNPFGLKVTP